jgi:hypothetical protein
MRVALFVLINQSSQRSLQFSKLVVAYQFVITTILEKRIVIETNAAFGECVGFGKVTCMIANLIAPKMTPKRNAIFIAVQDQIRFRFSEVQRAPSRMYFQLPP